MLVGRRIVFDVMKNTVSRDRHDVRRVTVEVPNFMQILAQKRCGRNGERAMIATR